MATIQDTNNNNDSFDNSHQVGVWCKGEGVGFIQLTQSLEDFMEEHGIPETEDVSFRYLGDDKNQKPYFNVMLPEGDEALVIGRYFPKKGLSLKAIKTHKKDFTYSFSSGEYTVESLDTDF